MRLLSDDGSGSRLTLTKDLTDDIPPYAILSHAWGPDHEEITFQDVVKERGRDKDGYRKIEFCRTQAASDGLRYFWIDSCCIDKANSTELSQAINSMFRWYCGASKCYVYLSDVSSLVEFFSCEGKHLRSKASLERQIQEITGIPSAALRSTPLSGFSLKERMLWAKGRTTKLEEDGAYSMLGIFDVHMPLIYGEGVRNAFIRLEDTLDRKRAFERGLGQVTGNDSSLYQMFIKPEAKPYHATTERTQGQTEMLSEAEQACTRSLWFPSMDQRRLSVDNPAKETCSWLFEHKLYQDWFFGGNTGDDHGLLWLKGKPGVGKSVLIKEAFRRASTGQDKSRHRTAAFFFNARGDELERSTLGLFRSLLYQLLPKSPKQLLRLCRTRDERTYDDPWREMELQDKFQSMFSDLSEQMTFLFIDKIDECDSQTARRQVSFWHRLTELAGNSVKVCISSRHFPYVSTGLSPIITIENCNGHDIALYVEQRLQFGMVAAGPERETLRDNLLVKSSGIFLWLVLVLDNILAKWDDGKHIRYLLKQLEDVPQELAALFSRMVSSPSSADRHLTLRFFQWAILAVEPLRLHEWHSIMAFIREPSPSSLREWRSSDNFTETGDQLEKMIKSVSRGLVEVKAIMDEPLEERLNFFSIRAGAGSLDLEHGETRVVQVIHESVREFFLHGGGVSTLDHGSESSIIGRGHIYIMDTCLNYMNITELDALVRARSAATQNEKHRSTSHAVDPSHAPQPDNTKRARSLSRLDTDRKRRKISSNSELEQRAMQAEDVSDAEALDHPDETAVSIDIIQWLEALSTDSTMFDRTASRTSPCNSSRAFSFTGKSQVLEDYAALLSYATTRFFTHARLAQAVGADPAPIISHLVHARSWTRCVVLSEEVPLGTSIYAYAQSHSLTSWTFCIDNDSDLLGEINRQDFSPLPIYITIGLEEGYQDWSDLPECYESSSDKYDRRAKSVASFSSASSHGSEIGARIHLEQWPPNEAIMLEQLGIDELIPTEQWAVVD